MAIGGAILILTIILWGGPMAEEKHFNQNKDNNEPPKQPILNPIGEVQLGEGPREHSHVERIELVKKRSSR
jgi:hypothetical protein